MPMHALPQLCWPRNPFSLAKISKKKTSVLALLSVSAAGKLDFVSDNSSRWNEMNPFVHALIHRSFLHSHTCIHHGVCVCVSNHVCQTRDWAPPYSIWIDRLPHDSEKKQERKAHHFLYIHSHSSCFLFLGLFVFLEGMHSMACCPPARMHTSILVYHLHLRVCFLFINASSSLNPIPYRRAKTKQEEEEKKNHPWPS